MSVIIKRALIQFGMEYPNQITQHHVGLHNGRFPEVISSTGCRPQVIVIYIAFSHSLCLCGAKTILWNGPAGVFEFDNFTAGSRAIAEAIAEATKNGAFSLIGGGDSVACINKFGMADQVSYISTGGGALLEAIEGKILPGIAAIKG